MDQSSECLEDQNVSNSTDNGGAHKDSGGADHTSSKARRHAAACYPCPENTNEAEFKSEGPYWLDRGNLKSIVFGL